MNDENPWIMTYTGKKMYLLEPDPEKIDIVDIAHSLSLLCRWVGHTRNFISVAEHCYTVSHLIREEEHALCGLLHDAAEAYLGDISNPLKRLLPDYRRIEEIWDGVILDKFGICNGPEVKHADLTHMAMEIQYLMPNWATDLQLPEPPPGKYILPHNSIEAKNLFLSRFDMLAGSGCRGR